MVMSVAMEIASYEKWVTWFVSKHDRWRRCGGGGRQQSGGTEVSADGRMAQAEWKETRPDTRTMSDDTNSGSGSEVCVETVFSWTRMSHSAMSPHQWCV